MASLLDMVLGQQNSGAVEQVAKSLNIDPADALKGLGSLLPALQGGMKKNISQQGGLESLLEALNQDRNSRYIDSPELLDQQSSIDNGNSILGHILGTKDRSREVAREASQQTGLDSSLLKKLLPMAATIFMGSLSKKQAEEPMGRNPNLLESILDSDGDGSMMDDLLGMAGEFFR
ncbi:MAG: DUF937 domain-containing protein [Kangiellaceae bacterium]|nr:DUF937 domain-containing protein [Kangiellaceae bacterium]